jgi:hypothetical protein
MVWETWGWCCLRDMHRSLISRPEIAVPAVVIVVWVAAAAVYAAVFSY